MTDLTASADAPLDDADAVADARPGSRGRRLDARRNLEAIVLAAADTLAVTPRASMQEIARAAGLHRATVHRHFPARDDLLAAVRDHAFAVAGAQMADDAASGGDAGEVLERLVRGQIEINDRFHIQRYVPLITGRREADRPDRLAPMARVIERAQATGAVRGDLPAAELAIAISGLILATIPELSQKRMTVDDAVAFCLTLVRAPGS